MISLNQISCLIFIWINLQIFISSNLLLIIILLLFKEVKILISIFIINQFSVHSIIIFQLFNFLFMLPIISYNFHLLILFLEFLQFFKYLLEFMIKSPLLNYLSHSILQHSSRYHYKFQLCKLILKRNLLIVKTHLLETNLLILYSVEQM